MNNKFFLSLFVIASLLMGCKEDNESTVPLPTGMVSTYIIPTVVRENISSAMPIHEGNNPPDIRGEYLASPYVIAASSLSYDEIGDQYGDCYFAFQGSHSRNTVGQYYEQQGNGHSENDKSVVQVTGNGNYFTAYFITETYHDYDDDGVNESWSRKSTVVSGEITSYGIRNFYYGFVLLDKTDPLECMIPVNSWRIFTDDDAYASINYWLAPRRTGTIEESEVKPIKKSMYEK